MTEVAPESSIRKQSVGAFKPTKDTKAVQVDPEDTNKTVQIGCGLSSQQEHELTEFLLRNRDVFTWKPFDMPKILRQVAEHSLDVLPRSKLVKQRLRYFDDERRKAIGEEIARLLTAGFIKEVFHPE